MKDVVAEEKKEEEKKIEKKLQMAFRPSVEQMEKIGNVKKNYSLETDSQAIKKIIDMYIPVCESCYAGNAKRAKKNGETIFLCETCNANDTH